MLWWKTLSGISPHPTQLMRDLGIYLAAFIQANLLVTLMGFWSWLKLVYIRLRLSEGLKRINELTCISPLWEERAWLEAQSADSCTWKMLLPVCGGKGTVLIKGSLFPWPPTVCTHQELPHSILGEKICMRSRSVSECHSYFKTKLYVTGLRQTRVYNCLKTWKESSEWKHSTWHFIYLYFTSLLRPISMFLLIE